MEATFFTTPEEFREWLLHHHKTEKELLVGFYKVGSGKPSMTWPQSVDQALCFGWIDGVTRSIDEHRYCIRFTPRKPGSIWSAVNIRKVAELRKSGLMTAAGEKAFELKKADRTGIYSHEREPSVLTPEFEKLFKRNRVAWNFFQKQAPSYQKVMIHWIMTAKQEKTRRSRLEKTIAISEQQKRML